ncbi:unnamed protein product, partial [Ectocarpus fasciculatus]
APSGVSRGVGVSVLTTTPPSSTKSRTGCETLSVFAGLVPSRLPDEMFSTVMSRWKTPWKPLRRTPNRTLFLVAGGSVPVPAASTTSSADPTGSRRSRAAILSSCVTAAAVPPPVSLPSTSSQSTMSSPGAALSRPHTKRYTSGSALVTFSSSREPYTTRLPDDSPVAPRPGAAAATLPRAAEPFPAIITTSLPEPHSPSPPLLGASSENASEPCRRRRRMLTPTVPTNLIVSSNSRSAAGRADAAASPPVGLD